MAEGRRQDGNHCASNRAEGQKKSGHCGRRRLLLARWVLLVLPSRNAVVQCCSTHVQCSSRGFCTVLQTIPALPTPPTTCTASVLLCYRSADHIRCCSRTPPAQPLGHVVRAGSESITVGAVQCVLPSPAHANRGTSGNTCSHHT